MRRNSRASVERASSAMAPASSTPVGPPPTTTKVSSRAISAESGWLSAHSNALNSRSLIVSASSSVFSTVACAAHSSWPNQL